MKKKTAEQVKVLIDFFAGVVLVWCWRVGLRRNRCDACSMVASGAFQEPQADKGGAGSRKKKTKA